MQLRHIPVCRGQRLRNSQCVELDLRANATLEHDVVLVHGLLLLAHSVRLVLCTEPGVGKPT